MVMSLVLPALSSRTRGRPRHRQGRGSWSFDHPENDLYPGRRPPFSARRRAVGLDRGRVDGGRGVDAAVAGQGLEDVVPDTLPAPAVEPVVDRRVRPVLGGAVAPARTRLKHMDNPGDDPVIVAPPRTAPTARQVRLHASSSSQ